jgi:hypothetical protein
MKTATIVVVLGLAQTGCGLFIHNATPVGGVADSDREVVAKGLNEPNQIRLTKPAKVAGFDLAVGSLVTRQNTINYELTSAGPITVSGVALPPGSRIQLEKANSIFTGDRYNWTGVAYAGAEATFGGQPVEAGDRLYFAGRNPFGTPPLAQLQITRSRAVNGKEYPAGTLFDFEDDGTISGAYTPGQQRSLAAAREQRKKERAQREKDCKLRCAGAAEFGLCMSRCTSE